MAVPVTLSRFMIGELASFYNRLTHIFMSNGKLCI